MADVDSDDLEAVPPLKRSSDLPSLSTMKLKKREEFILPTMPIVI
jgi:hypothetical protein